MVINKIEENNKLVVALVGKLDSMTFSTLEKEIDEMDLEGKTVCLDLKDLEYISSAGLRVVLKLKKIMDIAEARHKFIIDKWYEYFHEIRFYC